MAEIDGDEIRDPAAHHQIDGKARILRAHVDACALENEPHDPEFSARGRHIGELETHNDATIRQRVAIGALAKAPHEKARVEIARFDAVAGIHQPPLAERANHGAKCLTGGREPVFMARAIDAGAPLDDAVIFELAQARHQHGARDQRHAAMDVVEAVNVGHQFAQDQRRPARGKDFRCLCDRAELIVMRLHERVS